MAHSYAYLRKKAGLTPPTGLAKPARSYVCALFHMPALRGMRDDQAVTELRSLNNWRDHEWVEWMAGNYAALHRDDPTQGLTTFFPDHP